MNKPIIRSGFGNFSYVLGPWTDYFPTNLSNLDAQFGVGVGTEITAGDKGATISSITVMPPFNEAGSNNSIPWRLVVIRGRAPDSLYDLQRATNGWPRFGGSGGQFEILFEAMIAAVTVANNATDTQTKHFPFPDFTGPQVGPGEVMTVLFAPIFNETGVPGYGAANKSFASLSVFGSMARGTNNAKSADTGARALPRGIAGR
jgi:hypothetical protein